jgi:trans-2,3-dihydro-3-hydroxyanthranilate isomerase
LPHKHAFVQVDAFTSKPLAGNPCAVVFDGDKLTDAQKKAIAKETNLSETAFVTHSHRADFGARYFTPAEGIPMAGHPTLATIAALVDAGKLKLKGPRQTVTLELRAGVIEVEILSSGGKVQKISLSVLKPAFLETHRPDNVLPAFGLDRSDLLPGAVIQTVSTGTPQLMVPLRGHAALKRARMDQELYARLRAKSNFFSPHLFCLQGATVEGRTFARHFGTPPDLLEDPFTGSATGGMAAYLWGYGLIDSPRFIAEQGHWMGRPGRAEVEVVGPRDNIRTVKVGGQAVVVLRGQLEF